MNSWGRFGGRTYDLINGCWRYVTSHVANALAQCVSRWELRGGSETDNGA